MLCRAAVLLLAALSLAAGKPFRYDGYSVYHVVPASERDVNFLNEFARKHFNDIDFWRQAAVPNKAAHVMVSPETQSSFQRALEEKGMKYSVSIEDVQELIDSQHPAEESSGLVDWDDYHSLEDVTLQ